MTNEVLSKIDPTREYELQEIVDKGLIPGVTGYAGAYNLVNVKIPDTSKKTGYTHVLAEVTTSKHIKATHKGKPWNKISGKIVILGGDIVKFLHLNKII